MTTPLRLVLFGLIVTGCPSSSDVKDSIADAGSPDSAVPAKLGESSPEAVALVDVGPAATQEQDEALVVETGDPSGEAEIVGERADEGTETPQELDLGSVRKASWYERLASGSGPDDEDDDDDGDDDPKPPPNCPPEVRRIEDQHHCWFDAVATWRLEDVRFDTPVDLELSIPARPTKRNWVKAKGRIPWKELRSALEIQHTIETHGLTDAPHIMNYQGEDTPLPDDTTSAFFWWPSDETPILVLPHRQKRGRLRFVGVILASKTEAGWRAVDLDVVTSKHEGWGGSAMLESGVGLRVDGRELFTLAQIGDEGEPGRVQERHLCRVRWEGARLARACVDTWKDTGYP